MTVVFNYFFKCHFSCVTVHNTLPAWRAVIQLKGFILEIPMKDPVYATGDISGAGAMTYC